MSFGPPDEGGPVSSDMASGVALGTPLLSGACMGRGRTVNTDEIHRRFMILMYIDKLTILAQTTCLASFGPGVDIAGFPESLFLLIHQ